MMVYRFIDILPPGGYYYLHFTDEKTKAYRQDATFPMSFEAKVLCVQSLRTQGVQIHTPVGARQLRQNSDVAGSKAIVW